MSFVDPEFFLFLPVFLVGCAVFRGPARVWFYLVISYLFYAAAFPPDTVLLLFITIVNFTAGLGLQSARDRLTRRVVLILAVGSSLAVLGWFKYAGWAAGLIDALAGAMAWEWRIGLDDAALPIGISFYTFQALSYTLDVYRGRTGVTRSFRDFACFVAFFPQLVAGPIVRSREFLPQIPVHRPLVRENTARGIELILCGYFKKCVIADNLAPIVDYVFAYPQLQSGLMLWFGTLCFAAQIYGDFSGYSDIARGLGRIAGFDIPVNFRWPYLSRSVRDFWRRWHITLSFWLRDYVYISLGGRRKAAGRFVFNLVFTWLLCGLWHGAGGTFVLWGLYHGALLAGGHLLEATRPGRWWGRMPGLVRTLWTFFLVLCGWVLFRAGSLPEAWLIYRRMFSFGSGFLSGIDDIALPLTGLGLAAAVHALTYYFQYDADSRSLLTKAPYPVRTAAVAVIALVILIFSGKQETFIYFTF